MGGVETEATIEDLEENKEVAWTLTLPPWAQVTELRQVSSSRDLRQLPQSYSCQFLPPTPTPSLLTVTPCICIVPLEQPKKLSSMNVISVEIYRTRRDQLQNPELFKWTGDLRSKGRHWVPRGNDNVTAHGCRPTQHWLCILSVDLSGEASSLRKTGSTESLRKNMSHLSSIFLSFLEDLGLLVWAQESEKGKEVNRLAS